MFLRLLSIYFWYLLIQSWLSYEHVSFLSPEFSPEGLLTILKVVLIFPVIEEYLVRYWLYGNNRLLRNGFFCGFVCFVVAVAGRLGNIFGPQLLTDWTVVLPFVVGAITTILLQYLQANSIFFTNIFDKLKHNWFVFAGMCAFFIAYHLPRLEWFDLDFVGVYWMGAVGLTYIAKRYGLAFTVFTHILYNALALSADITVADVLGNIDRSYFYLLFPTCLVLLGVYHYWIYRLKKNSEYTPRLWFPN